ncbi:hypothetical protein HYALB_00002063 [Hymenoscyphus albidus]|uniref:Myb-like domain-containing protein n=1 Tax=Hymenoscyphus albidus TaxID=595503 RepID=A0A9N9LA66_9HELO|nr:hypothetical protein HYALB_00002063 [Hymenoscyphus albidus]
MFMNAEPRIVLNDFETFVPVYRADPMHQSLVEMTNKNNDVKFWNGFGSVAPSQQNGNWNQRIPIDTFGSVETPQVHNTGYERYFVEQSPTSVPPLAVNHLPRVGSYTISTQQEQTYKRSLMQHHASTGMMNQFQEQDPMLATPYHRWDYGRDGLTEFAASQSGYQGYPYNMNSNETDIKPFGLQSSVPSNQPSYTNQGSLSIPTYDSTYPTYAPTSTPLASQPSTNYDMASSSTDEPSWMLASKAPLYQNPFGYPPTHHGLPHSVNTSSQQPLQQQSYLWDSDADADMIKWNPHADTPSTISPQKMHLANVSPPASFSYSASGPETSSTQTDSSSGAEDSDYPASENLKVLKEPTPIRPTRQKLPDCSGPHRQAPILPSSDYRSTTKGRKDPIPKTKSIRHSRTKYHSNENGRTPKIEKASKHAAESRSQNSTPKKLQPNGPTPTSDWNGTPQPSAKIQAVNPQNAKDQFLVESKLAGMSYKDIRRKGGFTEAESTLRGRFRTLTKHKLARVRKPAWTENDIALLRKAVRKLTHGTDPNHCKVPWKQVAEYIANNGGSYHFGNATCRKKWDKLQRESGAEIASEDKFR